MAKRSEHLRLAEIAKLKDELKTSRELNDAMREEVRTIRELLVKTKGENDVLTKEIQWHKGQSIRLVEAIHRMSER